MSYYIATTPDAPASTVTLARATPRARLEDAVSDMAEGVVFNRFGDIVAFHERHMRILAHRGSARMTNVCECGNTAQGGLCDWCEGLEGLPPHEGHVSHFTGAWYCDTCDSPYCERA